MTAASTVSESYSPKGSETFPERVASKSRVNTKMILIILGALSAAVVTGLGITGLATHSVSWLNMGEPALLAMAVGPGTLAFLNFAALKGIKALQEKKAQASSFLLQKQNERRVQETEHRVQETERLNAILNSATPENIPAHLDKNYYNNNLQSHTFTHKNIYPNYNEDDNQNSYTPNEYLIIIKKQGESAKAIKLEKFFPSENEDLSSVMGLSKALMDHRWTFKRPCCINDRVGGAREGSVLSQNRAYGSVHGSSC